MKYSVEEGFVIKMKHLQIDKYYNILYPVLHCVALYRLSFLNACHTLYS